MTKAVIIIVILLILLIIALLIIEFTSKKWSCKEGGCEKVIGGKYSSYDECKAKCTNV